MRLWFRRSWRRIRRSLGRWRSVRGEIPGYWPILATYCTEHGDGLQYDFNLDRWVDTGIPNGYVRCPICRSLYAVEGRPPYKLPIWCAECEVDLW